MFKTDLFGAVCIVAACFACYRIGRHVGSMEAGVLDILAEIFTIPDKNGKVNFLDEY